MPSIHNLPSFRHYNSVIKSKGEIDMKDMSKFTIRIDSELLHKFRSVAEYNARSANRELEVLMKKHIAEFEKEHGKIEES